MKVVNCTQFRFVGKVEVLRPHLVVVEQEQKVIDSKNEPEH
jgi:hypothetical protein